LVIGDWGFIGDWGAAGAAAGVGVCTPSLTESPITNPQSTTTQQSKITDRRIVLIMSLEIARISASSAPAPGVRVEPTVTKLVDTTTCIGCKACEVACQEWNDLPPEPAGRTLTYQTLPETTANFWNLIKFAEHEDEGALRWLMRKDQCMHCAEPGCLIACPAPGAIVQYTNGIVDFQQDHCIGCGYCVTGCPFDVPKFNPDTRRVYKCTLCIDRVSVGLQPACVKACPTSCLQFGAKEDMLEAAGKRVEQLRAGGFANAAVYDPPGVGGTSVVTVLAFGDRPELYGLPSDPTVPLGVRLWKGPVKWFGNLGMLAGLALAAVHYVRYGRKNGGGQRA
jgi:formate dehydrogenase beta subunit